MKSLCNENYLPKGGGGGGAVIAFKSTPAWGVKSRKLTLVFILLCWNTSVTFDDVKPRRVWRKNLLM